MLEIFVISASVNRGNMERWWGHFWKVMMIQIASNNEVDLTIVFKCVRSLTPDSVNPA